jgi:vancomycin resistance protein VanJ
MSVAKQDNPVNPPQPSTAPSQIASAGSRFSRFVRVLCFAYLAVVIAAWITLQWADLWWPATLLMFAPRWLFAMPLVILVPLVLLSRSRQIMSLLVLLVTGLIIGWPLMGFNIPWQRLTQDSPSGTSVRVLTLNMHYSKADPESLENLIAASNLDIVAIQEWNGHAHSPLRTIPGWHVHPDSRLFLASRYPIRKVEELGTDSTGERASVTHFELDSAIGPIHVFSLHMATTRDGIHDTIHESHKGPGELRANSALRREQLDFVLGRAAECSGPLLIVGDMNTPPESSILDEMRDDYADAFTESGWGWGYTFIGAKTTVRIDHILGRKGWNCKSCRVGPFVGSPHRPVIAELVWTGQN